MCCDEVDHRLRIITTRATAPFTRLRTRKVYYKIADWFGGPMTYHMADVIDSFLEKYITCVGPGIIVHPFPS